MSTTYSVNMGIMEGIAEEMGALGNRISGMITQMNTDIQASLGDDWAGNAVQAFQQYKNAWTTAANDLPTQGHNAANAISGIAEAYGQADAKGTQLWER
jgi:WXG100 family type VII secretion target